MNTSVERGHERIGAALGVLARRIDWLTDVGKTENRSTRLYTELAGMLWLQTILRLDTSVTILDAARCTPLPNELPDE